MLNSECSYNCCAYTSGGLTDQQYSLCSTSLTCPGPMNYNTQQKTYGCTTDSYGDTCGGKCCSATSINGSAFSTSTCTSKAYCEGYYVQGILDSTTLSGAKNYKEVVEGGLATSTAIVIGITVPIIIILLLLIIWFIFKIKKGNMAIQGINTDISGRYNEANMTTIR
jgi:hypothetical protein